MVWDVTFITALQPYLSGVPKSFFTSYGRAGQPPSDISMYEAKMKELEQQGFGSTHTGIHIKHLTNRKKKYFFNI